LHRIAFPVVSEWCEESPWITPQPEREASIATDFRHAHI
jgi:hypothetical protein